MNRVRILLASTLVAAALNAAAGMSIEYCPAYIDCSWDQLDTCRAYSGPDVWQV